MVRQGIRKAREKLIELSLRNGMLNYRHLESSSRHVRVVHQLPGAVVECLASQKSIDLLPLPPVETIPRDEDTDVFRAALKEAKTVDLECLAAEDAKRAAARRQPTHRCWCWPSTWRNGSRVANMSSPLSGATTTRPRTSPCARSCGSTELSCQNMIQKKARIITSHPSPRPCLTVHAGACAV